MSSAKWRHFCLRLIVYLYLYLMSCICICIWSDFSRCICICIWISGKNVFVFVFVFDKTYLTPALDYSNYNLTTLASASGWLPSSITWNSDKSTSRKPFFRNPNVIKSIWLRESPWKILTENPKFKLKFSLCSILLSVCNKEVYFMYYTCI